MSEMLGRADMLCPTDFVCFVPGADMHGTLKSLRFDHRTDA